MSECNSWQKSRCNSTKKFSCPTISARLLGLVASRETRGKPSGSILLADKNDETGVMLRVVGELAVEEKCRSFCGEVNMGGMEDAEVPRGGVSAMADEGRVSRSTFSAKAVIRLAIPWNTSVTLTIALVALRQSRPTIAIKA